LGTGGSNQTGLSPSSTILGAASTGGLRPTSTLENPYPTEIQQPTGSSLGLATFLGRSLTFFNTKPRNPYSIRWNLDLQRQLTHSLVFELGYTGNHSVHLPIDQQVDFLAQRYLSTSPSRDQAVIDRNSANVANPFANLLPGTNLNGATVQFSQLVLPFPQFTGINSQAQNDGSSYFHGLTARLEK